MAWSHSKILKKSKIRSGHRLLNFNENTKNCGQRSRIFSYLILLMALFIKYIKE